ncbi:MAG TPA: LON peptidase substrate-binding domain-containing protein [Solirubrobacteraceae bacterium]|nr:LON peptidase substrate-binding domain-containing protein [Solirubrobacteraceae bacterium]
MSQERLERDFPLFPLGLVALPTEVVPLHIFEERYKIMVGLCVEEEREFGIVWMGEDGLAEVGCACEVERVIEELEDGRMNILVRGTGAIRVLERQGHLPYPAGVVERLEDREEAVDAALADQTRAAYAVLVERATERRLDPEELGNLDAYGMAATVEFGLEAKQGLLELRGENARLRLALRLFRAAAKRMDFIDRAQARARSNGKVRF